MGCVEEESSFEDESMTKWFGIRLEKKTQSAGVTQEFADRGGEFTDQHDRPPPGPGDKKVLDNLQIPYLRASEDTPRVKN